MSLAFQAFPWCPRQAYAEAAVAHYRTELREELLGRPVMMSDDPAFLALCDALSAEVGLTRRQGTCLAVAHRTERLPGRESE